MGLFDRLQADKKDRGALYTLARGIRGAYAHSPIAIVRELQGLLTLDGPPREVVWNTQHPEDSWWTVLAAPDIILLDSGTETRGMFANLVMQNDQVKADTGHYPDWLPGTGQYLISRYALARFAGTYEWNLWRPPLIVNPFDGPPQGAPFIEWPGFGQKLMEHIRGILSQNPGVYQNAIFAGHSLGGADGATLAAFLGMFPQAPSLKKMLVTFGAPRVVNPTLATLARTRVTTIRIANDRDPIPQVPPEFWIGQAVPLLYVPRTNHYEHFGTFYRLYPDGSLYNEEDKGFSNWVSLNVFRIYPGDNSTWITPVLEQNHSINEYIARLSPEADPTAPPTQIEGVPNPPVDSISPVLFGSNNVANYKMDVEGKAMGSGLAFNLTWYWSTQLTIERAMEVALRPTADRIAKLLGGNADPNDPGSSRILRTRISNVAVTGDSLVETFEERGGAEAPIWAGPPGNGDSDRPTSSILLRIEASSLYRRSFWLGGIPDALIVKGGILVNPLPPAWKEAYDDFRKWMLGLPPYSNTGPPFALKVRNKLLAADEITDIQVITTPPNVGRVIITTSLPHGLNGGESVKVSNVKWKPSSTPTPGTQNSAPRGHYTVDQSYSLGLNTFSLKGALFSGTYDRDGYTQTDEEIFVPMTNIIIRGPRSRDRGIPSDRPRGRRRGR